MEQRYTSDTPKSHKIKTTVSCGEWAPSPLYSAEFCCKTFDPDNRVDAAKHFMQTLLKIKATLHGLQEASLQIAGIERFAVELSTVVKCSTRFTSNVSGLDIMAEVICAPQHNSPVSDFPPGPCVLNPRCPDYSRFVVDLLKSLKSYKSS